MKITDIISRAGRNLRQAKVRTLLTALAISVGAFTITLALAAGTGAHEYLQQLITSNGDTKRLIVAPNNSTEARATANQQTAPAKYEPGKSVQRLPQLHDSDLQRINEIAHVASAEPLYNIQATYMQRDESSQKYRPEVSVKQNEAHVDLVAGVLDAKQQLGAGQAMVSQSYLDSLGFANAQAAIGQTFLLHFDQPSNPRGTGQTMKFTIAAVNTQSSTSLSATNGIMLSSSDGATIYNFQNPGSSSTEYTAITVEADDPNNVAAIKAAIQKDGYQAFSFQDISGALFQFINIATYGIAGFGILSIIASIFGIINTQYISVIERTQQIGLMKALGARGRDIGRLFRYEAAWVGFLGGVIGTVGALLVGLSNPWIASKLGLDKGTTLLMYKPLYSVLLIAGLMLIAVVAGYFPSRKAAKLDPIEALRTE